MIRSWPTLFATLAILSVPIHRPSRSPLLSARAPAASKCTRCCLASLAAIRSPFTRRLDRSRVKCVQFIVERFYLVLSVPFWRLTSRTHFPPHSFITSLP